VIPVNFHHLYYFWQTIKAGSITKARKKLLLAQPTLSLQLQELERSLGKKLMSRSHRGVSLTSDGRIAFEYCERIFGQGEQLLAAMKKEAGSRGSVLHLGIEEMIPRDVAVRMIDALRPCGRRLKTCIFGGAQADLTDRLSRHALDLVASAVDLSAIMGREFVSRPVARVPVVFVGSERMARQVKRFPSDLAKVPLLLRTAGNPVRKQVDQFLARRKLEASVETEVEDSDLLRLLALRGRGLAALNLLTIAGDLKRGRLIQVHPRPIGIFEPVHFTVSRHRHSDPRLQRAIDILMTEFALEL